MTYTLHTVPVKAIPLSWFSRIKHTLYFTFVIILILTCKFVKFVTCYKYNLKSDGQIIYILDYTFAFSRFMQTNTFNLTVNSH